MTDVRPLKTQKVSVAVTTPPAQVVPPPFPPVMVFQTVANKLICAGFVGVTIASALGVIMLPCIPR